MALIGWWKFDEGTGTTAADSGTGGNDGTLTSMTNDDWVTGPNGLPALDFDGTNDRVIMGDIDIIDGLSTLSMCAHINLDDVSSFSVVIGKSLTAGDNVSFIFGTYLGAVYARASGDGSSSSRVFWDSANVLSTGTDYHIAVTLDTSTWTAIAYLDGVPLAWTKTNSTTGSTIYAGNAEFMVGASEFSTTDANFVNGRIADPRVYDSILSAGEVATLAAMSSATQLIISDISHPHTVDQLALTQANVLTISAQQHAHSVDSLLLDLSKTLIIPDSLHTHLVDPLSLTTKSILAISDSLHSHSVDSLLLGTQETLIISDSLHTHLVDPLSLIQKQVLAISGLLHSHAIDQVILVFTPYIEPDPNAVITYTCTITAPTFSDLVVPISSFQMTLRQSTNQCYLSVVIPKILDYADDINDRAAGEVTIAQLRDGVSTNLLTANLNTIRTDQGALNRTGTVVSYKQITFPGTGSFPLVGASYRSSTDGLKRYRATPHPSVKPTDEVTINGETFDVETVTWTVSVRTQVMEISELLP